jgi:hypothetical protein
MRTRTLMLALIGVILASASIDAHSNGTRTTASAASEMVDRTHKSDRWRTSAETGGLASPNLRLPRGCDALVNALTRSRLARIATRCGS